MIYNYEYYFSRVGKCKSWTLDSGLDRGMDCGLDYGLIFGLDYGLSLALVTTISDHTGGGSVLLTFIMIPVVLQ